MITSTYLELIRWIQELDEVITLSDIRLIARKKSANSVYRMIRSLVKDGTLIKVKRGIYATKKASLTTIAHRIYPDSYISTGTVLAKSGIIGSVPARRVQCVRIGVPRKINCELGTIEYLSIAPKLYFGYEPRNNQLWAIPEKAYLDVCYYFYKGKKFSFNPESDVNHEILNRKVLNRFLKHYDKRFITFFKETFLHE